MAKLGTVIEEADESAYWMELIIEGGLMPRSRVEALHGEANQLVAIMVSSRRSCAQRSHTTKPTNRKSTIENRQ